MLCTMKDVINFTSYNELEPKGILTVSPSVSPSTTPLTESNKTVVLPFQHIYFTQGFAISGQFTEDGKDYNPPSHHGCLKSGYFCIKNVIEKPMDLITYIVVRAKIYKTSEYLYKYYKGIVPFGSDL